MDLAPFHYHAPRSLDDAVALLARLGDDGRILSGGQSLMPQMGARLAQPGHIVDINRIPRLDRLSQSVGRLRIPPLVRHATFERPDVVEGPLADLLALVARKAGPLPVRAAGTVCGSLAAAHGASVWCVAALALNADVAVRSHARGARTIAATALFRGAMTTALADDEMIVEVQVPILPRHARWGYAEAGRQGLAWPAVLTIAVYERDEDDMHNVRIAMGGVEGSAIRLSAAERVLERRQPTKRLFREAADAAAASVAPLRDPRDDPDYRRDLVRATVTRALDGTLK